MSQYYRVRDGVVPTVLEILWDAESPNAVPMGRKLALVSRAMPSSALSGGLVKLLRLSALGQLCELPSHQRIVLCQDLKQRLAARSTAAEMLALCCPENNELEIEEVPSWSDLLASDVSLMYDVGALLGCAVIALLLLSLGDVMVAPLVHCFSYLTWRKAGPSTTRKVAAIEASGLMSPVDAAVFAPPLLRQEPQHPVQAPPIIAGGNVPSRTTTVSSLPNSAGSASLVVSGKVVLEADGLERWYDDYCALRDVSLSVRERECVGLLGQSGAGKSTTLRMLSGELLPTAWLNRRLRPRPALPEDRLRHPSTGGYVPELTARQHLELLAALRLLPHRNVDALVGHVLRLVDLDLEADKMTQLYCRSSLRKLGLAMALLGAPRLLLLDAPTSGVDPITARSMWHTVDTFAKTNSQAVVLATTL
ncbi:hypothetical protein HPB51_008240 [Rhipicephalus microplus]|uniref:ABC transporter domain-containing protein n=1 Tax=Rhipicephalus microplus TaxID=6941 RepID=A0A9J6EZM5_RHIMP|nr:hypothetical protein HPB51_008240 [Rhipicephalus microplus]